MKSIIHGQEPDLTSLNHLIYTAAVTSAELCNVKIKPLKSNVPKERAWQEILNGKLHFLCSEMSKMTTI